MGKKGQGVIFMLLGVGGFARLFEMSNTAIPAQAALDMLSIGIPVGLFVIGIVLLFLGVRDASTKPYE